MSKETIPVESGVKERLMGEIDFNLGPISGSLDVVENEIQ